MFVTDEMSSIGISVIEEHSAQKLDMSVTLPVEKRGISRSTLHLDSMLLMLVADCVGSAGNTASEEHPSKAELKLVTAEVSIKLTDVRASHHWQNPSRLVTPVEFAPRISLTMLPVPYSK